MTINIVWLFLIGGLIVGWLAGFIAGAFYAEKVMKDIIKKL